MKKEILFGLAIGLFALTGCQDELYKDVTEEFKSPQGIYVANKGPVQIFVEEGQEVTVKDLNVALSQKSNKEMQASIEAGNQSQLDAYNKKNNTEYILLPKEMYEIPSVLTFKAGIAKQAITMKLKDLKFPIAGDYALPIRLKGGTTSVIEGEDEALLVVEKRIQTKSLRINGSGSENASMFPSDFKVDQWTMEVMVNRASYSINNRAICGTKLVQNAGPQDEIYTRFGDVTISPNQLQIKTGSSQIDVDKSKFAANPNTWYMITFVYDGHKNKVYINGELVAEREIRTGPYGMVGFWLSGANELIREVRFWKTARTAQQIKAYTWKMVNPDEEDLLLYYPLNGMKRDANSKEITKDESQLWDWSKNAKHLPKPSNSVFDDNGGNSFVFPIK